MEDENEIELTNMTASGVADEAEGRILAHYKFVEITYSVAFKKGESKPILKGISGYVQSGQVLAIIGSSGAGKTTLLDILSNREKKGVVDGKVLVNGENVKKDKKG